jgi:hypothetical protein
VEIAFLLGDGYSDPITLSPAAHPAAT